MILLSFFIISIIAAFVAFIISKISKHGEFHFYEFLAYIGAVGLVIGISAGIIYYNNTHDVEILNGKITAKTSERVSCEHSYECNCYTTCSGSGNSQSCSTHCSTCYEHSYDISWFYLVDYGFTAIKDDINRIDSRGLREPPRWTAIEIGEPASRQNSFTNYIKAAPDSLIRRTAAIEKYKNQIPDYPGVIYDYYRIDRLVTVGVTTQKAHWNDQISQINKIVGPKKQANVIVVLLRNQTEDFYYALEQAWLGGKKNDVITVINLDEKDDIVWVRVMAWTNHNAFRYALRDEILSIKKLDREKVLNSIEKRVLSDFIRKPMAEFEYLSSTVTPTPVQYMVTGIIVIIVSIGLIVFFHVNDIFDNDIGEWKWGKSSQRRY